ncbi:SURF1 family protein [Qipengyuania pacifica]|nr:SURF1 family protein [Qipengyuania aerophila]
MAFAAFAALGVWQLERLAWKRSLIARVESRVNAAPVTLAEAHGVRGPTLASEYRRVMLKGAFLRSRTTLVETVTELGPGYWVLDPFEDTSGTVLVNRGFLPQADKAHLPAPPRAHVRIIGLIRLSEPKGRFLRTNVPSSDRWFTRDVAAIAATRGVKVSSGIFIDDQVYIEGQVPIAGLTQTTFRNAHLQYAFTWFALALVSAFGFWKIIRLKQR